MAREAVDAPALAAAVLRGERAALARAITLVESRREVDRDPARALLRAILPATGKAWRVGISGVPGAGKSTLIDRLGMQRADAGQRLAVLSVDPSSTISGGSLLGDKSRMSGLARHERAFVRPSPSSTALGGVATRTREVSLLCEAAGHELILVETVGVGQSEVRVADLVDCSVVLLVAGAGDELQGLKRGILEHADVLVVHKADGAGREAAEACRSEFAGALHHQRSPRRSWTPRVLCVSSTTGEGLDELWSAIEEQHAALAASGELDELRGRQAERWLRERCEDQLQQAFAADAPVLAARAALEDELRGGRLLPEEAAERLIEVFRQGPPRA